MHGLVLSLERERIEKFFFSASASASLFIILLRFIPLLVFPVSIGVSSLSILFQDDALALFLFCLLYHDFNAVDIPHLFVWFRLMPNLSPFQIALLDSLPLTPSRCYCFIPFFLSFTTVPFIIYSLDDIERQD